MTHQARLRMPGHTPRLHRTGGSRIMDYWICTCGTPLAATRAQARDVMRYHRIDVWVKKDGAASIEDLSAVADAAAAPYMSYCDACSGLLRPDHFRLHTPDGETFHFHDHACIRDWIES